MQRLKGVGEACAGQRGRADGCSGWMVVLFCSSVRRNVPIKEKRGARDLTMEEMEPCLLVAFEVYLVFGGFRVIGLR